MIFRSVDIGVNVVMFDVIFWYIVSCNTFTHTRLNINAYLLIDCWYPWLSRMSQDVAGRIIFLNCCVNMFSELRLNNNLYLIFRNLPPAQSKCETLLEPTLAFFYINASQLLLCVTLVLLVVWSSSCLCGGHRLASDFAHIQTTKVSAPPKHNFKKKLPIPKFISSFPNTQTRRLTTEPWKLRDIYVGISKK